MKKIGVLALQGDFQEHAAVLRRLGVEAVEVRLPEHLEGLDGIILPGGESTTIGKLAHEYGLLDALRGKADSLPMWGTCGGLVFMAREVGHEQPLLGIMDMLVERNAFGRQVDSFEEDLEIAGIEGGPFHGVFIRAPEVKSVGPNVRVLCRLADGRIVAAQQGRLLVTSFHPELTRDDRLHRYFLGLAASQGGRSVAATPSGAKISPHLPLRNRG
ncbi:MAG: pyridoxal 5'-phosphate synthase glutaminase subunit PdxT [Desulfomonile tiedjei]|nr:pyridoxal 5'-phosphate synthase glutaminase subunit PdxT [Desulfomonile tiedjei]